MTTNVAVEELPKYLVGRKRDDPSRQIRVVVTASDHVISSVAVICEHTRTVAMPATDAI